MKKTSLPPPAKSSRSTGGNTFRPLAVTFEDRDVMRALPTVRRLVDLCFDRAMAFPNHRRPGDPLAYELMVVNLLLPTEVGTVVMQMRQHGLLTKFLREQIGQLVLTRLSPFWDVSAERVYADVLTVLDVVEEYTSIRPLWS